MSANNTQPAVDEDEKAQVLTPRRSQQGENPFDFPQDKTKIWTPYEIGKTVLLTVLLVPVIRILLFILAASIGNLACTLALNGWNQKDENGNVRIMPDERYWYVANIIPLMARIILFAWGFHWIEVKGSYDPKARVIVANHTSMVDGVFIFSHIVPMVVAKADVGTMPIFGKILHACHAIFVDRVNKDNKRWTLDEMSRRARLPRAPPLLIFPEGTTTNANSLVTFKQGAFAVGLPIQPVILDFNKNKHYKLPWIPGSPPTIEHMLHIFCQFHNYATVTFLPTYIPTQEEVEKPQLFSDNIRNQMARVMRVPMLAHSVEDSLIYYYAITKKFNVKINFIYEEFRSAFKVQSIKELEEIMRSFVEFDIKKDSFIDFQEFKTALHVDEEKEAHAKNLFNGFDTNKDGALDFKEFVWGVYKLTQGSYEENEGLLNALTQLLGVSDEELEREEAIKVTQASIEGLSYGDAAKQVDEAMNADRDRRLAFKSGGRKGSFTGLASAASKKEELKNLPPTFRTILDTRAKIRRGEEIKGINFSEKGTGLL